ncbi:endonuclease I family protein, partial [Stutzerimonas frequens]|uniref:endonuclease I family protein n=1 Tax=Stutzerimonas frequens TaxID=2968969 RepID=UPI0022DE4E58
VGELNGDRSNFRFGMIPGEPRAYGACDFEVDFKQRVAEPPESVRGDIARTYFYMEDQYGLRISRKQRQLFEAWGRMDPVDAAERARAKRIEAIQGNGNPFVR